MRSNRALSPATFVAAVLCLLVNSPWALAVVLSSGSNANTDAASLTLAGGPGNPALPGFVSVGKSSTGNASVTYLGNRWVITAAHVTIDNDLNHNPNAPTPIRFGNNSYLADMSSIHVLHNPDNSLSDLQVFRLQTDPGLPSVIPSLINNAPPSGRAIMIGNGLSDDQPQQYWNVNMANPNSWVWNSQPAPGSPGANDFSGFHNDFSAAHVIRWGENTVHTTGEVVTVGLQPPNNDPINVYGFTTAFDHPQYQYADAPLPSEAQATNGDSGGAVFSFVGGQWKLSGIMVTTFIWNNQPSSTAVFGDLTLIADLSVYRDQILMIVPEPTGEVLALVGAGAFALVCRRRRR